MAFILGKKLKMTQIWKDGKVVPVTVVHAEPNTVSIVRTKEIDGYEAVQVALGKKKKEFKATAASAIDLASFKKGDAVGVDTFKEGEKVRVSGIMKGRGFQGVVKRHNFAGGPKTHGQKNRHRAPGSIGSTAFQRVVPGRRMAGRMGGTRVTIKNLVIAAVDKENNLLFLRGAVPAIAVKLLKFANNIMNADVYNLRNEKVGTVELPERVFGVRWNANLVKQVLDAQLANKRTPWAHTKDRSEVRGGGKKPWAQKGTGRARHGSTRSPLWVGGGKAHGPRNERDYTQKVNKKMKRHALFAVLSKKAKDGEIKVIDSMAMDAPKTKVLASALNGILNMKKGEKRFDVLLVGEVANKNLFRASGNLQKTMAIAATSLNVHDVINHKNLFIEKDSVATIEKHYATK